MTLGRVAFVLTLALSLSACRNRKEEARQKAEMTAALDQFKAQTADLVKQAADLRARFDKLPEDLPGMEPVRESLHALEEGLGVEDGRGKWLAGELDKAFASGNKEEIETVRKAIPRGDGGMSQMLVKVAHEMAPLERLAAQRQFFEQLDAAKARGGSNERTPKAHEPR